MIKRGIFKANDIRGITEGARPGVGRVWSVRDRGRFG